jgi:indole-3-glycerol phosphate synthase
MNNILPILSTAALTCFLSDNIIIPVKAFEQPVSNPLFSSITLHNNIHQGIHKRYLPSIHYSTPSSSALFSSYYSENEDLYATVHRKEHEMKKVNQQHSSLSDPVRMAIGYVLEDGNTNTSKDDGSNNPDDKQRPTRTLRLAKALRRVYDDPDNIANPNRRQLSDEELQRQDKLAEYGMKDMSMRRGSFIVDIKRKSLSRPKNQIFANFDDAGMVAEAMVSLGADVVFVNVDYHGYGGDISELRSAVRAVRQISKTAAVVMKDIVVDEIQLGLAKDAGADGVLLMSSVLGPALPNFLDLCTTIGLETIVECHTLNEVKAALDALAQNIMVNNYDRLGKKYYPDQAYKLAGLFPGSGGPIICIAGGGIETTEEMKRLLAVGYDGVVVGKAVMGSAKAPEFIRAVRDRTLLPAEFSQWGLEDAEFDMDGNIMSGPKKGIPGMDDGDVFM